VLSQYELQWLLCAIILNYQSISDFRKQRPSGLKICLNSLFLFLKILTSLDVKSAIDGTKAERIAVRKPIKENLDVEQLSVLVDKSYQWKEIAQCISNNIITIEAHPTLGTNKESVKQPDYLVANLNTMQKTTAILVPKETLKPQEKMA
jgi:hypothetical protein